MKLSVSWLQYCENLQISKYPPLEHVFNIQNSICLLYITDQPQFRHPLTTLPPAINTTRNRHTPNPTSHRPLRNSSRQTTARSPLTSFHPRRHRELQPPWSPNSARVERNRTAASEALDHSFVPQSVDTLCKLDHSGKPARDYVYYGDVFWVGRATGTGVYEFWKVGSIDAFKVDKLFTESVMVLGMKTTLSKLPMGGGSQAAPW